LSLLGTISAVGEEVTCFKVGDPVFTGRSVSGTYAEYSVSDENRTFDLDLNNLTFEQGACLGTPYFTAYRALFTRYIARSYLALQIPPYSEYKGSKGRGLYFE